MVPFWGSQQEGSWYFGVYIADSLFWETATYLNNPITISSADLCWRNLHPKQPTALTLRYLGVMKGFHRDIIPLKENQREKNMGNEERDSGSIHRFMGKLPSSRAMFFSF